MDDRNTRYRGKQSLLQKQEQNRINHVLLQSHAIFLLNLNSKPRQHYEEVFILSEVEFDNFRASGLTSGVRGP